MSNQRFPGFGLNTSASIVTVCFVFFVAVLAFSIYSIGSFTTITTPPAPLAYSLANILYAMAGFYAARLFGGRHNFTGRLLQFYSGALLLSAFSWSLWGIFAGGEVPPFGSKAELLMAGSIVGHAIAGFALLISARALMTKMSSRQVVMVLAALAFSLGLSLITAFYLASPLSQIIFGGIWPAVIFSQLSGGLLLLSMLGRWYIARPLAGIAFSYLGFSIAVPLIIMVGLVGSFPFADIWLTVLIAAAVSNYIVGLSMTQVRPIRQDVPSSIRGAHLERVRT